MNRPTVDASSLLVRRTASRADSSAKLTTSHGKLNLPAEVGLSWFLPRLIGVTKANDLLLSSRVFLTEEAYELGLLNAVLPADELLPHTYRYVRQLIDTVSPGSLRETKRQIYTDLHRDAKSAVEDSYAIIRKMVKEDDFAEGVAAFMEKRPPRWSNS